MTRGTFTSEPDPWRVPVNVALMPDTGVHRDIEADPAVRQAIAATADLREVLSAQASLDVTPKGGGRFQVTGRVRARIGQTCVVSLEEIENDIDEPIDVMFAPPEQIPEMADLVDENEEGDEETPDPPEPIVNGFIDLGPRKPDVVFEPVVEAPDPEDHPFAALKALKVDSKKPARGKASAKPPSKPKGT